MPVFWTTDTTKSRLEPATIALASELANISTNISSVWKLDCVLFALLFLGNLCIFLRIGEYLCEYFLCLEAGFGRNCDIISW